jgi:class 3 adenylate cyclase
LRIRDHVATNRFEGRKIDLRIGINSGPVVAGVVGTHKFAYDLWGDVVNTASRMESAGVPGAIQITDATFELIKNEFVCEPRGVIAVKGKGQAMTYFLLRRRP